MTISVQSPTAALVALEGLSSAQTGAAGATEQNGLATQSPVQPSTILDVSGAAAPGGLGPVTAGLARAASIADAAVSAGEAVISLLAQMRQTALGAADLSLPADARAKLSAAFKADLGKIDPLVRQAAVGGVNLVDGSVSGDLQIGAGETPGAATLTGANLSLGGPLLGLSSSADIAGPDAAAAQADAIGAAIAKAQAA